MTQIPQLQILNKYQVQTIKQDVMNILNKRCTEAKEALDESFKAYKESMLANDFIALELKGLVDTATKVRDTFEKESNDYTTFDYVQMEINHQVNWYIRNEFTKENPLNEFYFGSYNNSWIPEFVESILVTKEVASRDALVAYAVDRTIAEIASRTKVVF